MPCRLNARVVMLFKIENAVIQVGGVLIRSRFLESLNLYKVSSGRSG